MTSIQLKNGVDFKIFDIREDYGCLNLQEEIINGITSNPPTLPSVLLWDDDGQKLFHHFSQTPSYYPFHSEVEILDRYSSDIVGNITGGGALLELGCGTSEKTKLILSTFISEQKPIHYFALDVSREGLTSSIAKLARATENSPFITMTGLLGTYDDCISWLRRPNILSGLSSVTFLWMGNSVANFDQQNVASDLLGRFRGACQQSRLGCKFLISIDICQHDSKVLEAYSVEKQESRLFLLNALRAANLALYPNGHRCGNAFHLQDWGIDISLDRDEKVLHYYVVPRRDLEFSVDDTETITVKIRQGERVHVISSGKWTEDVMQQVCADAGLRIQKRWKDECEDYCKMIEYRMSNFLSLRANHTCMNPFTAAGIFSLAIDDNLAERYERRKTMGWSQI